MDINKILEEIGDVPVGQIGKEQTLEGRLKVYQAALKELEAHHKNDKQTEIALLDKEIKNIKAEIAVKKNRGKNFNKRLFIANVKELAKQKKIKFGDIESASGTSIGYISKLDKPDNPNDPSAEFIATASKMLDVTTDDLMNKDFRQPAPALSDNERYISKFLDRLINETLSEGLTWDVQTEKYLKGLDCLNTGIDYYVEHPLFDAFMYDCGIDETTGYPEYDYKAGYVSKFYDEGTTGINGPAYTAPLTGTDATIYIMNVMHFSSAQQSIFDVTPEGDREIYIVDNDTVEALCSTAFTCEEIKKRIITLYNMINDSNGKLNISRKSRTLINGFMDATVHPSK
mgnify:CR=1 FL=1